MRLGFIGDVHGRFAHLEKMIYKLYTEHGVEKIIQLGDMGFGWPGDIAPKVMSPVPFEWIDGNHENFDLLWTPREEITHKGWKNFLKCFEYMERGSVRDGVMYIGGAHSIDQAYRIPHKSWWPQENISYSQTENILQTARAWQGEIHTVVSHDCPASFDMSVVIGSGKVVDHNRRVLEEVRKILRPRRWVFAHYHQKVEGMFEGCYYRCVDMLRGIESEDFLVVDI